MTDAGPTDDQLNAFEERMRVRRAAEIAEDEAEAEKIIREAEEAVKNFQRLEELGPRYG